MSESLYDILGVERDTPKEDIKRAFRKLASKHHPDKPTGDKESMQKIQEAHDVLMDDERRAEYDLTGKTGKKSDIDQGAATILAVEFDAWLEKGSASSNAIEWVSSIINSNLSNQRSQLSRLSELIDRVEGKRGKVKRKSKGHCIYTVLIEEKITKMLELKEQMKSSIAMMERALAMLNDDYESVIDQAPPEARFKFYLSSSRFATGEGL